MRCEVLSTETNAEFQAAVQRAVSQLRTGGLVALPTETVYGLAANALDAGAVQQIFEVKGRPASNPLIVHVASLAMARKVVARWPRRAQLLAIAFWPGPLTLVLPKSRKIPDVVSAGGPTVAVRWPRHWVTEAVIRKCGFPLAAPSANRSTEVSPTLARHVAKGLGRRISLILDGGAAWAGIESTVLDLTGTLPRILRPGPIHAESIAAVIGPLAKTGGAPVGPSKSPGQMPKHYSPRAKLFLFSTANLSELTQYVAQQKFPKRAIHLLCRKLNVAHLRFGELCLMPRRPEAYARALYGELHRCDEAGADLILVETPPRGPQWEAIRDRLQRAACVEPEPVLSSRRAGN